jgi:hypothetical protein
MRETRIRRGKVVVIPEEWQGKTVDRQTIRKRPSKLTRKLRNETKFRDVHGDKRQRMEARAPKVEEWE